MYKQSTSCLLLYFSFSVWLQMYSVFSESLLIHKEITSYTSINVFKRKFKYKAWKHDKEKELTHYIVRGRYVTGKTVSSKNIDGTHPELHLSPNPQTLHPVLLRLAMRPRGHRPPWSLVLSHLNQVLFDWHNIGQPNWKHMALVLFLICWTSPARNRKWIISFY